MNIIGLDIGGTKICGICFDGKKAVKVLSIPTPKSEGSFKASLKKMVDTLCAGSKVNGVGIGVAGIVDRQKGRVVSSPNLKFLSNLDLTSVITGFKKIKVDNDADCFVRAEAKLGQGKGFRNFIGITLGTGVGSGLVLSGEVFLGASGSAGEIGHIIYEDGRSAEEAFQKAKESSNYKALAKVTGALLASVCNTLDPQVIILGGSVAIKSGEKFLPAALEFAQKNILNPNIKVKVLVSKLENAGAIGAALLV